MEKSSMKNCQKNSSSISLLVIKVQRIMFLILFKSGNMRFFLQKRDHFLYQVNYIYIFSKSHKQKHQPTIISMEKGL